MHLDFLDKADLSLVQALLILARYLQNTRLSTRCWNVVGIALRMAQGLGLHLEKDGDTTSPLEKEMRRRVWHSCTCLDTHDVPPSWSPSLFFSDPSYHIKGLGYVDGSTVLELTHGRGSASNLTRQGNFRSGFDRKRAP